MTDALGDRSNSWRKLAGDTSGPLSVDVEKGTESGDAAFDHSSCRRCKAPLPYGDRLLRRLRIRRLFVVMSDYEKRLDVAIGKAITDRREAVGMTQRRLGEAMGVTFQQVQKYEIGKNRVAASKLVLAAQALRCDVAELVGEEREDLPGTARLIRAWSKLNAHQRDAVTSMIEAFE